MNTRQRWFVRGDIDGFFGLFVDNLLALMLIMILGPYACGFPVGFIASRILPGVAISVLAGNLFYAWQARYVARSQGRVDVTALPFGVNTLSLLAFIFLVMAPIYHETGDADKAWRVGLAACFLSGIFETLGAFVGDWIRRKTPRAALLSGLAGMALSFIVLSFSIQIFSNSVLAIVPALVMLVLYGSRIRLPLHIPSGAAVIGLFVIVAWVFKTMGLLEFSTPSEPMGFDWHAPAFFIGPLFQMLSSPEGWRSMAVILPVALFNVIGSIQNLDSAEAAGDSFHTRPSLLVNGVSTLLASVMGSPFPTTIYLGHPGWKAMGARTGYSILNGVFISGLCCIGGMSFVMKVVPLETALGLLVWVGAVLVSQAFSESDRRHGVAVVIGLVPPLAAWAVQIIEATLRAAGTNLYDLYDRFEGELYIDGFLSLQQGFLLISIVLSAIVAHAIDRRFIAAAVWSFLAALLSMGGVIHAFNLTSSGLAASVRWMAAPHFFAGYLVLGVFLLGLNRLARQGK